jgi:hypothetical protein
MDPNTVVALVAAVFAAVAALISAWYSQKSTREDRQNTADEVALRYREPLLQAAFNLQTRLYNIVGLRFFERFMTDDNSVEEREYAIEHTLYLIGQYFCWVEILRRESQFLDPRDLQRNRVLAEQLESIRDAFAASTDNAGLLRIFRGEQRAIAEVMMTKTSNLPVSGAPRYDCQGYGAFIHDRMDSEIDRWFRHLRSDLKCYAFNPAGNGRRMVLIQNELVNLVNLLDPEMHRVSGQMRKHLAIPRVGAEGGSVDHRG